MKEEVVDFESVYPYIRVGYSCSSNNSAPASWCFKICLSLPSHNL